MKLTVLSPGLHTLPVDLGRPRTRSLGVPLGGAADRAALAIGNALVGNPPDSCALEVTLIGPTLQADCDLACVVHGAPFELYCRGQPLKSGVTFTLPAGVTLHIGATPSGARAYLCISGGFPMPVILGSRSGFAPVQAGAELPCMPSKITRRFVHWQPTWNQEPKVLRTLEGAQASWFEREDFYRQEFLVTPTSNRMGLRLAGSPVVMPARELMSEPVCPGTVQVTRDGQCILLGVEGQTIGGYPKIAQVISADVDKLGQLRPGDRIRFAPVGLEEAEQIRHQRHAELNEWISRLLATC